MCIIVNKKFENSNFLIKNRDRAYKPSLEIVHEIVNGVEIAYLRDTITDWSEGLNEYGIGIVNTALMVGFDESEKKIVKKRGKPSKDGKRIREVLSKKTTKEVVETALYYNGGIKGHTFIGTPKKTLTIERTSKHKAKLKVHSNEDIVRTNHGHFYPDAGYTKGNDYLSSKIRKTLAEKIAKTVSTPYDLMVGMRKTNYKPKSNLNMWRNTNKMFSSSQICLNLTNKVLKVILREEKIESYLGINNKLPKGYTPRIKIEVFKTKM